MAEEETERKKPRPARKITRQRLKNIALYYLQRFETSSENLKAVLLLRVNVMRFRIRTGTGRKPLAGLMKLLPSLRGTVMWTMPVLPR